MYAVQLCKQSCCSFLRGLLYDRERAAGLYAVLPYAIAQGAVELPFVLVQAVIFTCIAYFMIYFEISAGATLR